MKLLLHTCCAPCLTGSRIPFQEEGFVINAYWYNPNIHPFTEHERRFQTFQRYLFLEPMEYVIEEGFLQYEFIKGQIDASASIEENEELKKSSGSMGPLQRKERCRFCYTNRMESTARFAKEKGYDCYSTTMLLSRHQDHELIRKVCNKMADRYGIEFIYKDLRKQWKDSIRISKELRLYKQSYCGCVFSEHERYIND